MSFWQMFVMGLGLGLGAGITPGPLLGLVINETLHGGWRAGVLVASAPLITDLAIIGGAFFLLVGLPPLIYPILSIGGGFYVLFLGWETLRTTTGATGPAVEGINKAFPSLWKGMTVNLLNPHPYLFWLTVGGPLITESYQQQAWMPIVAFLGGFYSCLVGSKALLALLVHGGRTQLQGRGYRVALRISGGLLLFFGMVLVWNGVQELWSGV